MRRAPIRRSVARWDACNMLQTLVPARSTKSDPRNALSDACMGSRNRVGRADGERSAAGVDPRRRRIERPRRDDHGSQLQPAVHRTERSIIAVARRFAPCGTGSLLIMLDLHLTVSHVIVPCRAFTA